VSGAVVSGLCCIFLLQAQDRHVLCTSSQDRHVLCILYWTTWTLHASVQRLQFKVSTSRPGGGLSCRRRHRRLGIARGLGRRPALRISSASQVVLVLCLCPLPQSISVADHTRRLHNVLSTTTYLDLACCCIITSRVSVAASTRLSDARHLANSARVAVCPIRVRFPRRFTASE
jgi:hypothetical protein